MQIFNLSLAVYLQLNLGFVRSKENLSSQGINNASIDFHQRRSLIQNKFCGDWELDETIKGTAENDYFGSAVATSSDGRIIAVGAPRGSSQKHDGYVKVYEYSPQKKKIEALGTNFEIKPKTRAGLAIEKAGSSISLSDNGKVLAIANVENKNEDHNDSNIFLMSGGVTVYALEDQTNGTRIWRQIGDRVKIYGGFYQSYASVKLSGDGKSFVFASSGGGVGKHGSIKVFKNVDDEWVMKGHSISEKSDNKYVSDEIEVTMSKDGNMIAIGSGRNSHQGAEHGRVRVYTFENEDWNRLGDSLFGSDDYELFGNSIDMSSDGKFLAVGSVASNGSTGKVRVFNFDTSLKQWRQVGSDLIGPKKRSYFGCSVAISSTDNGMFLAIGALGVHHSKGSSTIYYFNKDWVKFGEEIKAMGSSHFFGASIDLSSDGKRVVVGAPFSGLTGLNSGAAYSFEWVEKSCSPTRSPSSRPSITSSNPTLSTRPTLTQSPSLRPTLSRPPSSKPTKFPTSLPSMKPTRSMIPSAFPTMKHSANPTSSPSSKPTVRPTVVPSHGPTYLPSLQPSVKPSTAPSYLPTFNPTSIPSKTPTPLPTAIPSKSPTPSPTGVPSHRPTAVPTSLPSHKPSSPPTSPPTLPPSEQPTSRPTSSPTSSPTHSPTNDPTDLPTKQPSPAPSKLPTDLPSLVPTESHAPTKKSSQISEVNSVGVLNAKISGAAKYELSSVFLMGTTIFAAIITTFV